MRTVALTGNVAAGKSSVAALFRRWGATIIDADAIVRELQQPGQPVHAAIVARFGTDVLDADGALNRGALRARILADPAAREALNAIVHPAVLARRKTLAAEARAAGAQLIINDIPLLFELDLAGDYDVVILVDAPVAERLRRIVDDRGLAPAQAEALIAAQLPSDSKRTASSYVIDNDGTLEQLEQRARRVWDALTASASPA